MIDEIRDRKTPFILVKGDEKSIESILVISEMEVVYHANSMCKALIGMLGWYYIANIQYSQHVDNTLLYLENEILGVAVNQMPMKVKDFIRRLKK